MKNGRFLSTCWLAVRVAAIAAAVVAPSAHCANTASVSAPLTLTLTQDAVNSALRDALRADVQLGTIGVYDGSRWLRGNASIHFDRAEVVFGPSDLHLVLWATLNSPFGPRHQRISAAVPASNLRTTLDAGGFCDLLADLSGYVSAANDLRTDLYSGSQAAPDYIFRKALSNLALVRRFAQYSTSTRMDRCWPAFFTGEISMAATFSQGSMKLDIAPKVEYLAFTTSVSGTKSGSTIQVTFRTNFPMAFHAGGKTVTATDASGRKTTMSFGDLNSGLSSPDGSQWVTTATASYNGANGTSFPDVQFDLESPCGELVQHYKMLVVSPAVGFTLNSSAAIP